MLLSAVDCNWCVFVIVYLRYKILNPAAVDKEADGRKCADLILTSTPLDPDMYRLGHTKACLLQIRSPRSFVGFTLPSRCHHEHLFCDLSS